MHKYFTHTFSSYNQLSSLQFFQASQISLFIGFLAEASCLLTTSYTLPYSVCLLFSPARSSTWLKRMGLLPRIAAGLLVCSSLKMSAAVRSRLFSWGAGYEIGRAALPCRGEKDGKRECRRKRRSGSGLCPSKGCLRHVLRGIRHSF